MNLPLFPLGSVLFPGGVMPLRIFEQRYMDMAKQCLREESLFGVCLIREGSEVGTPAVPEPIGCTARISNWDMEQLGVLLVRAVGVAKFRVLQCDVTKSGLLVGDVEILPPEPGITLPEEYDACATLMKNIVENVGDIPFEPPLRFEDASWVGSRLSELLPIKMSAKQKLLELDDPMARLEVVMRFLEQQGKGR